MADLSGAPIGARSALVHRANSSKTRPSRAMSNCDQMGQEVDDSDSNQNVRARAPCGDFDRDAVCAL